MPFTTQTFVASPPRDTGAAANMVSDTHGSNAEVDGDAVLLTETAVIFTTVPMLGSPVQLRDQPVSLDVAAEAENSEGTLEQQALQPYSIPVNFSIVAATVRKEASTRLNSNSLSLAAAIEGVDQSATETLPGSEGEFNLVCLQCSMTGCVALRLND